jgi:hypothetical protein
MRAVAALAILKVNWDEQQDYIANFVPIVAHCLREVEAEAVSIPNLQEQIRDAFGLRIPQGPLKTILGRAGRAGIVTREHGVYRPNREALRDMTLGPARDGALRQHNHLVERLVEYANREQHRSWSHDQAERALLAHLEALAEPILAAVVEGEPVVELPKVDAEGAAVVGQFALHLYREEPEGFEYLETIVKGSMLAHVLYFPEAFSGGRPQLGETDIYLDTPVALRVLGYAAEHFRDPAIELVDLLRAQGASLKVFDHTLREIEGVLDSAARSYRTGRPSEFPGDVIDYFVEEELSPSDVQEVIAGIDDRLENHTIEVVPAPAQREDLTIDETELERLLQEEVGYRRREALLRDLDSLTAIHRLRGGELRRRIERSDAVLVSNNYSLARAGKNFFDSLYGTSGVPLCVLDSRVAAIAWLMSPVQAADLPRRQIIATSYAALSPSDAMWRRYLREVRKLASRGELSEDQVGLLTFAPEARLALMNETDGDVAAFGEGTVPRVLEHARHTAQAETKEELRLETERLERAEATIAEEKERTRKAVEDAASLAEAQRRRISATATQVARVTGWAVFILALAAITVGTGFATSGLFPASWSRAIPFVASALIVVAVIASLVTLVSGLALKDLIAAVERRLAPPIERTLSRIAAPPGRSSDELPRGDEAAQDRDARDA